MQMLEALVWAVIVYLEEHPNTPRLYQTHIAGIPGFLNYQYIPEITTEEWLDVPNIIREGGGDCEDLACMLVAQYYVDGIDALPRVRWRQLPTDAEKIRMKRGEHVDPSGAWRFHCLASVLGRAIRLPRMETLKRELFPSRLDPSSIYANPPEVEDPSALLGMSRYGEFLSGDYDPKKAERGLLNEARRCRDEGNTRAAKTLVLRANQLREEKGL
jgi:hypothetical protein